MPPMPYANLHDIYFSASRSPGIPESVNKEKKRIGHSLPICLLARPLVESHIDCLSLCLVVIRRRFIWDLLTLLRSSASFICFSDPRSLSLARVSAGLPWPVLRKLLVVNRLKQMCLPGFLRKLCGVVEPAIDLHELGLEVAEAAIVKDQLHLGPRNLRRDVSVRYRPDSCLPIPRAEPRRVCTRILAAEYLGRKRFEFLGRFGRQVDHLERGTCKDQCRRGLPLMSYLLFGS